MGFFFILITKGGAPPPKSASVNSFGKCSTTVIMYILGDNLSYKKLSFSDALFLAALNELPKNECIIFKYINQEYLKVQISFTDSKLNLHRS